MSDHRSTVLQVSLIEGLDSSIRDAVSDIFVRVAREKELAAGEVLYSKGAKQVGTGAILLQGAVSIDGKGGKPIAVSAPTMLGEMAQFAPEPCRSATVTATEPSVLLEFSWHDFVHGAMASLSRKEQAHLRDGLSDYVGVRFQSLADVEERRTSKRESAPEE